MNKIKDFIYNISDFVVVLIVVAAAVVLIGTRIDAVLAYPTQSGVVFEVDAGQAADDSGSELEAVSQIVAEEQDFVPGVVSDDGFIYGEDGVAYPNSVYIAYGSSLQTIGEAMVATRLFGSVEEFVEYVEAEGMTTSIQCGTFIIPQGASHEEVLSIITKPGQ